MDDDAYKPEDQGRRSIREKQGIQETAERKTAKAMYPGLIRLLLLLVFLGLLAAGCSLFRPEKGREVPCKVSAKDFAGIYGTKLASTHGPGVMIRLKLGADQGVEMSKDYADGKPSIVEVGNWACLKGNKMKVTLTPREDRAYEKPRVLTFHVDAEGLSAGEDEGDVWGVEGLRLERNPAITGLVWRLKEIRYRDNSVVTTNEPSRYILVLSLDGTVTVRADCNRGMGSYTLAGSSIVFYKLSYTHMICQPNSLFDTYTKALKEASSCTLGGGFLSMVLGEDGGVMKFEPAVWGE